MSPRILAGGGVPSPSVPTIRRRAGSPVLGIEPIPFARFDFAASVVGWRAHEPRPAMALLDSESCGGGLRVACARRAALAVRLRGERRRCQSVAADGGLLVCQVGASGAHDADGPEQKQQRCGAFLTGRQSDSPIRPISIRRIPIRRVPIRRVPIGWRSFVRAADEVRGYAKNSPGSVRARSPSRAPRRRARGLRPSEPSR